MMKRFAPRAFALVRGIATGCCGAIGSGRRSKWRIPASPYRMLRFKNRIRQGRVARMSSSAAP
jgi:hypothetical protein